MDRNEAIKAIRTGLKQRGHKFSVTGGRGTAWGWIHIDLFPTEDRANREQVKSRYDELAKALGFPVVNGSVGVPASSDYYREYIDRANGVTPAKLGEPYWD